LPVFKTLCQDNIWSVRKGCVESLVSVMATTNPETRTYFVPLMEQFLNDVCFFNSFHFFLYCKKKKKKKVGGHTYIEIAYEQLGPLISQLQSHQVKKELVNYFTNIPNLSSYEADTDCITHCSLHFPGVALALGKDRWQELNSTFHVLVRKSFQSRKSLSCSIHEICAILGTELTEIYLLDAIDFFLKDIDDVCLYLYLCQSQYKFFFFIIWMIDSDWCDKQLLENNTRYESKERDEYLDTLWELGSESDINWRFRLLLAELTNFFFFLQLHEMMGLYKSNQVVEHLIPLAFQLCDDRMADVRYAAVVPITQLIQVFYKESNYEQLEEVISKCDYIHGSKTYSKRLLLCDLFLCTLLFQIKSKKKKKKKKVYFLINNRYVKLCEACSTRIPIELFNKHFLPKLLDYANDRISNVRFALARLLSINLLNNSQFINREDVRSCVIKLKHDIEDVEIRRFFATESEIELFLQEKQSTVDDKSTTRSFQTNVFQSRSYYSSDDGIGEEGEGDDFDDIDNKNENENQTKSIRSNISSPFNFENLDLSKDILNYFPKAARPPTPFQFPNSKVQTHIGLSQETA
ncbi:protein phosphatase 4 regulatory subunit 1, partial [Reticulomyxa filosa]